jgi:hypothetical protein
MQRLVERSFSELEIEPQTSKNSHITEFQHPHKTKEKEKTTMNRVNKKNKKEWQQLRKGEWKSNRVVVA